MKAITHEEHNKILVDLLVYVDKVCRENDIKYTLLGGSLIGAIRHKGIIPWDDDIDIALMPEEYKKLLEVLGRNKNDHFVLMDHNIQPDYFYQFAKLVDTRTVLKEKNVREIAGYGVYLDIFQYCYLPNDEEQARRFFKKMVFVRRGMTLSVKAYSSWSQKAMAILARAVGTKRWVRWHEHLIKKAATGREYVMLNWPGRDASETGFKRECLSADSFKEYMDCTFEGHKAMIIRDYDAVLRKQFGDYMQLPPEEERKPHPVEAEYWKE